MPILRWNAAGRAEVFKRLARVAVGVAAGLYFAGAALGQTSDRYAPAEAYRQNGAAPAKGGDDVYGYKSLIVPYLFGHNRADAEAMARSAGLNPRFFGPAADNASVVNQSIPAGRQVPRGMTIVVRMGAVEAMARVPPLLGLNRVAAAARAEASGLKPMFYGPNAPGLLVASQSLTAGQEVARGTYIQLQMRAGQDQVRVPDFGGLSTDAARALAASNRLRPSFAAGAPMDGRVIGQVPAPGQEAPPGAVVQLQVAVSQVKVPSFLKRTRAAAEARAGRSGLVLDPSGDPGDGALVARQTPGSGAMVPPGSHVQVVMAAPAVPPVVPPVTGDATTPANGAVSGAAPAGSNPPPPPGTQATQEQTGSGKHGGGSALLAILGVVAAAIAAVIAWITRRRKPPIDDTEHEQPLPTVTYAATIDSGRPTVRLSGEPRFAARALTILGRGQGSQR